MVRRYRRKSQSDSKGLEEDGTGTAVAAEKKRSEKPVQRCLAWFEERQWIASRQRRASPAVGVFLMETYC